MFRGAGQQDIPADSSVVIEDLSRAHASALLGWARTRFADQRDAEEVVAETLALAWRRYDTFDPTRGSVRAWLFGIARNAASDHYRKSERHRRSISSDMSSVERQLDHAILDGELDRIVETSFLQDAMASLSESHRTVLVAAFFEGKSTKQIARELNIPDGTVKSRLFYGLRSIRSYLEEQEVLL